MVDYSKRRGAVRRKLKQEGLDVLLVTDETNVTYLTGFTGDSSYLLLAKSLPERFHVIDGTMPKEKVAEGVWAEVTTRFNL